jgi:threonine dehydrogenase-like Zn-dependent dehydrogenase
MRSGRDMELCRVLAAGDADHSRDDWLKSIELVREMKVQVGPVISRQEALERVAEVFATFEHGPGADI